MEGIRKGHHLSMESIRKGCLFRGKKGILKGKGSDLGAEPPHIKFSLVLSPRDLFLLCTSFDKSSFVDGGQRWKGKTAPPLSHHYAKM